jgi:hypothetical protein
MVASRLATTLSALALLFGDAEAHGQAQFAIAGDFLGMFRDAIAWDVATLETPKFQSDLVSNQLAVIVIPPSQANPNAPTVLVCTRKQTGLLQQDVTKADLDTLNEFVTNTVYQLLLDVNALVAAHPSGAPLTTETKQKINQLQKRMSAMPDTKRSSVTFLLGARLAQVEPTQPEVAEFVTTFRREAEKRAVGSLKAPRKEDLGRPQVFGPAGLTRGAIGSIKDVQEVVVAGHRYQKTWAGGSLVLVPQSPDAPRPHDSDPPLKKLGLHDDVHKVIKDAHPNHVIAKSSQIHR